MSRTPYPILYFNSWSTAHGGSSTSLLDIVRLLDRTRFEPAVVCPEPGELPERLSEIDVPVFIHSLSRPNREQGWRFLCEVPWYMRLLRRRRIALLHGNTSASRRSLLQAAQLARIPYVQHVRNGMDRPRAHFGCYYATRIIVNSDDASRALRADSLFASKTVTIHNGVDLSQYDAGDNRRGELDAGQRPIIGFVGQIVPRKGVKTLIEALPAIRRAHPDALLVIVGSAPADDRSYETSCRELVGALGLDDHVRFIGYRRDVPSWMRTFDVFVLPTFAEPFGKVVIEAMAAGCPVVASRVGGIPEIVDTPAVGTLVDPKDANALTQSVCAYLADRSQAAAVGAAARRHVYARFGLQAMVDQLQDLYTSVLVNRAPEAVAARAVTHRC
jgi:glycosyltransferase involved in cell wall biosynthesis